MVRFTTIAVVISLLSSSTLVAGYPSFTTKVPNGANVEGVPAIGHTNGYGGGDRNSFGDDFEEVGEAWTIKLCVSDSDGDGQTNGEELGDPCCTWSANSSSAPLWSSGVSNPGDDSSTSDKSLWPSFKCSNATLNSSTLAPDPGSASNSAGSATLAASTASTTSTTSTAATVAAIGVMALFLSFFA